MLKHLTKLFNTKTTFYIAVILIAIMLIITLLYAFFGLKFLEDILQRAENIKFLGFIMGGLFVILSLIYTAKQTDLTEENDLGTTFKDAVIMLGRANVAVKMGGVYTLLDIAKHNPTYVERINNILCRYIVEEADRESRKTSPYHNETLISPHQDTPIETYDSERIQELIDLIIIKNADIFAIHEKNLANAKLKDIQFSAAGTDDSKPLYINFNKARLQNCFFANLAITQANFNKATLVNCGFNSCTLSHATFTESIIENTKFTGSTLENTKFNGSILKKCDFSDGNFKNQEFNGGILENCNFYNNTLANIKLAPLEILGALNFINTAISYCSIFVKQCDRISFDNCQITNIDILEDNIKEIDFSNSAISNTKIGADVPNFILLSFNNSRLDTVLFYNGDAEKIVENIKDGNSIITNMFSNLEKFNKVVAQYGYQSMDVRK